MSEVTQDGRLLSLEESVRSLAATSERVEVGQNHLLSKVEQGFITVGIAHKQFADAQAHLDLRLKPLEESAASSKKRTELLKKLAIPGLGAMAGVFGAKFGNQIVAMLGSFFGR